MRVRPTKKRLENILEKIDIYKCNVFRTNKKRIFLYGYDYVINNSAYLHGLYNKADKETRRLIEYYDAQRWKRLMKG